MNHTELPFLSVTELAALIAKKEVSPVEVVEAYLMRIEQIDPQLHSYITVCADLARQAAKQAESEIRQGHYRGLLHGIPVAIKDQIYTKGIRTTSGSQVRAEFIPDEDATVVIKLQQAGAILLGKLNMSEFALGDPINSAFGIPRNPWDLQRNPGTSSSGSGAATAAFLCATSLGEDTGGSVRGPAAYCGLVGLRPSWGRVSRYGMDGACWSMDTLGPISRTVEDCAITLGAIAGYDPKDPYTWSVPVPDYRQALQESISGLKAGLVKEFLDSSSGIEPQTREAILLAAQVLSDLGMEVQEVSIPLAMQTGVIIRTISHVERVSLHPEWIRTRPQDHHHNTRIAFMTANLIPAQVYYKAQKLRTIVREQVLSALQQVDVLLQPTAAGPAPKLDFTPGVHSKEQAKKALIAASFRAVYSLANVPALSIPCGFTSSEDGGLPLAMQIAGRPFAEVTLLRVAYAYEQNTPWHTRRPPI